jgi:hypothetical protein
VYGRGQRSWSACSNHLCVPTGTKVLEIKEWYQNREDMLELKHINKTTGLHVDYFKPGHPQALCGVWIPWLGRPRAVVGEGRLHTMTLMGRTDPRHHGGPWVASMGITSDSVR